MRINLTVISGPQQGQVFDFEGHDLFLVGRSKRAHLCLTEKDGERGWYLSRLHFMIEVNPPRCRLLDLASRNGTFVNDARVKDAELKDGDEVRAGRSVLRVRLLEEELVTVRAVKTFSPARAGPTRGRCRLCGKVRSVAIQG